MYKLEKKTASAHRGLAWNSGYPNTNSRNGSLSLLLTVLFLAEKGPVPFQGWPGEVQRIRKEILMSTDLGN